jgi:hypothetical protein
MKTFIADIMPTINNNNGLNDLSNKTKEFIEEFNKNQSGIYGNINICESYIQIKKNN